MGRLSKTGCRMNKYNNHISYSLTGQISWGTQLCHYFRSKEELFEILIPFFMTGLKNNELCLWVISPLISMKEAEREMGQAVPEFTKYLERGQMKIVSYDTWDFKDGINSFNTVIHGLKSGLKKCTEGSYKGARIAVIFNSSEKQLNKEGREFERFFRESAGQCKVKAICSYSLERFDAPEILQTAFKHHRVILKCKGMWELFQSYGLQDLEEQLEEEKKFCAAIVDTFDNPVLILDSLGAIARINLPCERLIGSSQDKVKGKNLWQVLPIPQEDLDLARGAFEDLKAGKSVKIEHHWVTKEGKKHLVKWSSTPFRDRSGSVKYFICTGVDITEQKQAEKALQERESQYRTLVETVPEIIALINKEGKVTWVNQLGREFFGERIVQKSLHDYYIPKKKAQCFQEALLPLFQGEKETVKLETWLKSADGQEKLLQWNCKLLKEQLEEKVISVARDITSEYSMKSELKAATRLMEGVLDGISDMLGIQTPDYQVLRYNKAKHERLGVSPEEIKGEKCYQIIGRDKQCQDCLVPQVLKNKKMESKEKYVPEWDAYLDCLYHPILDEKGRVKYIVNQHRDITQQKRTEKELQKSEDQFRTIFERAAMGIAMCDLEGRMMVSNPALQRMLGYKEEELIGKAMKVFTHPEDVEKNLDLIQELVAGRRDYFSMEKRYIHKEGYPVWVRLSVALALARDQEGSPQFVIAMVEDITEKKVTDEALQDSEKQYRLLVERLPDAVLILQEKKIVFANQVAVGLAGVNSFDDLIDKEVKHFLSSDFWEENREDFRKALSKGREISIIKEQVTLHNGNILDVEMVLNPIIYKGSPSVLVVLRNITERNKMEEEFFKASKLESLGLLAGGIAHDFNNILAIILGNISLARMYQDQKEKFSLKLKEIEKAAIMAKDLTHQLHTFARGGEPVTQTVSVKELVQDTTSLILSGSNVRSEFSFPEDLYSVEVDAGQIRQVINNVIINALQAMPEGGTIRVGAENLVITNSDMESKVPLDKGHYVRVFIRDEGAGIPKEYRQSIFDPFFTTKEKGSGLGLATSYSIVKRHGGYITLDSQVGEGTTFYIYLPASPGVEEGYGKKQKNSQGKGRVLVMDDEEMLRDVVGEMLSLIGFEAVFARDGAEAVELYRRNLEIGHIFDAVIIDLTIPGGMGGKQTVQKLLEIDPKVKAIVTSGYFDDPVISQYEKFGFKGFVPKPYRIEDLAKVMLEIQKVSNIF